jgi:formate hydrogenlyase subunit 4
MIASLLSVGAFAVSIALPVLLLGLLNRTKSLWSGRRGAPVLQPLYDLVRLARKRPVYGNGTTAVFRLAPWLFLLSALASAAVIPALSGPALVSFRFDFVWFAYVWGLGRAATMLAALDTGSSFEGMGASREATFSALLEPVLFLSFGALALLTGRDTVADLLLTASARDPLSLSVLVGVSVALFVVLQVESARMPVDDPQTHLELTMIHEVMVLDHSGPDLAAIQYGAALKLYVGASAIASLLNPWSNQGWRAAVAHLGICAVIAVALGTVESLVARLQLRAIPQYITSGLVASGLALASAMARHGGSL